VVHFLELLSDMGPEAITEKVQKPLVGLRVAPYYGCMMLRPEEVGIDDPEEIPVFYFTQLMALASGLEPNLCGFKHNYVSAEELLRAKQLLPQ
jgi:heterodisulfide reductase subunit B